MSKARTISRLRAAAELRQALVERDVVRQSAPGDRPGEVAARLRANHDLRMVALRVIDTNHRKP